LLCYICDDELSKNNESEEHIIINAIGGKLKSKKLICSTCNTDFGVDIDSYLAKQLNDFSNMINIQRDRGTPNKIKAKKISGEDFLLDIGGKPMMAKPIINQIEKGDKTEISIVARNNKELKNILKGLSKKYKDFDADDLFKKAIWNSEYFNEKLQFGNEVGGKESFKAVCKCAMNYYVYKNGNISYIKHLIPYIKNNDKINFVNMHYQKDLYELDNNESTHIINIIGNPEEKILFAYIDYFNVHKYLVLLNDNYNGKIMNETYCFNLLTGEEIKKKININYTRNQVLDFIINSKINYDLVTESFNHFLKLALTKQDNEHRELLIKESINSSFSKYPENVPITKEMMDNITSELIQNLTPYIINKFSNK
jgi:hypothetical protein